MGNKETWWKKTWWWGAAVLWVYLSVKPCWVKSFLQEERKLQFAAPAINFLRQQEKVQQYWYLWKKQSLIFFLIKNWLTFHLSLYVQQSKIGNGSFCHKLSKHEFPENEEFQIIILWKTQYQSFINNCGFDF